MDLIEKQRRMTVLKKIDAWNKVRCSKCHEESEGNSDTAIKCTCKAAVAVRKLGVEYEEGGKLKRERRIKELLSAFRMPVPSVEVYDALKDYGIEDKQLIKHLNMRHNDFLAWKYNVGRKSRPPSRPGVIRERDQAQIEYAKWSKIAQARGVNKNTFSNRVRRLGLTPEQAAQPGQIKGAGRKSENPWVEVAKQNGVSAKTFSNRKRRGWTNEEAANVPVRKKEMANS